MQRIDRLRPRLVVLWWPTLILAGCCAVYGFFVGRQLDPSFEQLLYGSLGAILFLLWFIPSLSYAGTFADIYKDRLIIRRGLFGKKRTVLFADVLEISGGAVRGVVLAVRDQENAVLKRYPKPKAIAAQLNALAK